MKCRKKKPAIIVLAAGEGKRMASSKAKVLHDILDIPMVMYVVETAQKVAGSDVILVVGNQAKAVRKVVSERYDVIYSLQKEQLVANHGIDFAMFRYFFHTHQRKPLFESPPVQIQNEIVVYII